MLCGPSGSGKSSVVSMLTAEFPHSFGFSVSHTTRSPRPGEEDGVQYHFVQLEAMQAAIEAGDFIENAQFSGNLYGTSKSAVEKVLDEGKICILDIDVQGVKQIRQRRPLQDPYYVFIRPPSMRVLEERLRARKTESEESLLKRLEAAKLELEYGDTPGNFDLVVVNDDLDEAYAKLREFILPEIEKHAEKKQS